MPTNSYDTLWGKSARNKTTRTLLEHTRDVMDAAEALFGTAGEPTRLGFCWLAFFRLPRESWPIFHANLLAACGLHDWGKANDRMQNVLRGSGDTQAIRHEHFSALLIAQPVCWEWLGQRAELDREVILSAVLTHHLKADDGNLGYGFAIGSKGDSFRSLHNHGNFKEIIKLLESRLPSSKKPSLTLLDPLNIPDLWSFNGKGMNIFAERTRIMETLLEPFSDNIHPKIGNDTNRRRMLHAVRSALIGADAAGSGLVRVGIKSIPDWITEQFEKKSQLWDEQSVKKNVIDKRIRQLEALKKFEKWNEFQDDCADDAKVPARALLLAPCGSGKTLAAWRWIAARLKQNKTGHVLFLYPTRATATEGFRDYVSWAPEAEVALMHGTSEFDLKDMFGNEADPRHGLNYETEQRLFALRFWGRRAFSATVDQFLSFMNYSYGAVCMLPVLADSVVVIDEVHSFDRNMFTALKEFLRNFDVPVLCMTATLPGNRRDELTRSIEADGCGLTSYEERKGKLKTIAEQPRYRLWEILGDTEYVINKLEVAVRMALAAGKRVLWVVNTVNRAHAIVARFVKELPPNLHLGQELQTTLASGQSVPVICYHSRFRLIDRVNRHQATMRALKDKPGPALGITTQVCQMSLDIDVDLLVTEYCPVADLIQRMGRCNRDQDNPRPLGPLEKCGTGGEVLIYNPGQEAPYDKNKLMGLTEFLQRTTGRILSQKDLEQIMNHPKVPYPPSLGDTICPFLTSGPYAVIPRSDEEEAQTFREGNNFNRPCVLADDVTEFLKPDRENKVRPGLIVPVPDPERRNRLRDPENAQHRELPRYLGVAPADHYHTAVGFCDRTIAQWGDQ